MEPVRIGFIGLGKLGLPAAETLAMHWPVTGYDVKKVTSDKVFVAQSIAQVVSESDIVFCAVQTPHDERFGGDRPLPAERADFDYAYLRRAVSDIVSAASVLQKHITLVVISTCLPGTYKNQIKLLLNEWVNYIYNPFFIAMGTVVEDFLNPEFVLLGIDGTMSKPVMEPLKDIYRTLHGQDRTFVTDITTAEGIKVFYNTFITAKTVLGNLWGEMAHRLGMNVDDIHTALSKARDRLISPRYLKSGVGDGGACHPRDNIALSWLADELGLSYNIFDALMMARESHMEWLEEEFVDAMMKNDLPGIILGHSFKPRVNMQDGSAAILLANLLRRDGVEFEHYERDYPLPLPKAVYIIATKHAHYQELNFPAGSVVIDPFGYIPRRKGVEIIWIGR